MKKIIKIIFILVIFTIVMTLLEQVEAQTYNGKLYLEDSFCEVFAEEKENNMDYNGWYIKSTIDDKIYYYIEPKTSFKEETISTYTIDKKIMTEETKLTKEILNKINLLAYYGYGYQNKEIDHTSKKWYGITQVMIWRLVRPDLTWDFKESRYGFINKNLYENEIKELNKLIEEHTKKPSFSDKEYKITSGEILTLIDQNNVLETYDFTVSAKNAKLEKSNTWLRITATEPGIDEVILKKISKTKEKFSLLLSENNQNIITRGAPEEYYFSFILEVDGGVINIDKIDKDTKKGVPQGQASLENSIYEIYDENNKIKGQIITNTYGKGLIRLPNGKYKIKEIKPSEGYTLDTNIYEVEINNNRKYFTLETEIIKGTIILHKTNGGTGENYINEEDAVFEIYNNNDEKIQEIKTDENGIAKITLRFGTYKIKQIKGKENYVFVDDILVEVKENKIYNYELKNNKLSKIIIEKLDSYTNKPVKDITLEIYDIENNLIKEVTTNETGKVEIENLQIGRYYIIEKQVPIYYQITKEKIFFEITENGKIINLTIKNNRKKGTLILTIKDLEANIAIPNCKIEIYFTEENKKVYEGVTDKDGKIKIKNLFTGNYCLYQKEVPKGYLKNKDKICFEIKNENEIIKIEMSNDKIISIPNTMKEEINAIKTLGIILISIGTIFIIYEKRKEIKNK